jgi:hypothetical protein
MIKWDEVLYYDEESPSGLRWKIDIKVLKHKKRKLVSKDSVAGTRQYRKTGKPKAWVVTYCGVQYPAHRLVMVLFGASLSNSEVVDHLDRNPFNNLKSNLRIKSVSENNRNMPRNIRNKSCLLYTSDAADD